MKHRTLSVRWKLIQKTSQSASNICLRGEDDNSGDEELSKILKPGGEGQIPALVNSPLLQPGLKLPPAQSANMKCPHCAIPMNHFI